MNKKDEYVCCLDVKSKYEPKWGSYAFFTAEKEDKKMGNIVKDYCDGCVKINEVDMCSVYPRPEVLARVGCAFSPVAIARVEEREAAKKNTKLRAGQQKQKKK